MTERDALFANVLDQPADDTARLVLADWLDENGEEDFGQFLRAGVVAARFRGERLIEDRDYYAALARISAVAKTGAPVRWLAAPGLEPFAGQDWAWDNAGDRVTVRMGRSGAVFTRGLVTELEVTLEEWFAVAAPMLSAWPVEHVRASDVPGLSFDIRRLAGGWRLTGRVRLHQRNVPLIGYGMPAAIAPGAVLTEQAAEWAADQLFPDRDALIAGVATEAAAIVAELREAAAERWPRPPRRRR